MSAAAENLSFFTYNTPFGQISIQSNAQNVTRVVFGRAKMDGCEVATSLTNACAHQINEYLAGKRNAFDVPNYAEGTDFQKSVWSAVANIPYGQTRTASEVAQIIEAPSAVRAVGLAVKANPLPLLIPAHRIVSANGRVDAKDRSAVLRHKFRLLEAKYL